MVTRELIQRAERMITPPFSRHLSLRKSGGELDVYTFLSTIYLLGARGFSDIGLTGLQRNQSLIAVAGDSNNSLSMRWVKLGSMGAMNHAAGAGGGLHCVTTRCGCGVELD